MERVIFLEDYHPSLEIEKEEKIISLNPEVSYALEKRNIDYSILEDYYDQKELSNKAPKYFKEQLEWFAHLDNFIKENISYSKRYNILLALSNYLRMKYFLDSIIIYSYVLSKFFEGNSDLEKLTYFYIPEEDEEDSIFKFKARDRVAFRKVLELLAQKYEVAFAFRFIDIAESTPSKVKKESFTAPDFLKYQVKKFFNLFKYRKFKKLFSQDCSLNQLSILFMHAGSIDMDYPIKELIKYRAHIYLREKNYILREDSFLRRKIELPELDENFLRKLKEECQICAQKIEKNSKVVSWINEKCSLDVSSITVPFLKNFILKEAFYMLQDAERMYRFYCRNRINFLFARGNTDRDSQGPLIAARYMKGAKSICIQHACFALDSEVFGVFETETYDYIFVRDKIAYFYFKYSLKNRYNRDCTVVQSPHYLKSVAKSYSGCKLNAISCKSKIRKRKRETVVYVEKKFSDWVRCFNNMIYPLTWYYEFQKKVIDFFAQETKFDFIYKHAKGQKWAEGSILEYIRDKGADNIKVFDGHFLKVLKFADRVIVDYPSGALFEAAACGKPVLCICADYIRIIDRARQIFGRSLRQFKTDDEAIDLIKEFLYSDEQKYIVNLELDSGDFLNAFKEIIRT